MNDIEETDMAKEFKDFDSKYAHLKGKILEGEDAKYLAEKEKTAIGWPYYRDITLWSNAEIRTAVYESDTADAWQQFRVSLKGQSTEMKIARLEQRYLKIKEKVQMALHELGEENANMIVYDTSLSEEEKMEKCRIDNYIGALRRGGQLNRRFMVVG